MQIFYSRFLFLQSLGTTAVIVFSLLWAAPTPLLAQGNTVYKCTQNGKVQYSNSPCDLAAKPAQLKGTVNSMPKEAFVGQSKGADKNSKDSGAGRTILGITPPNPIEECRKKGGKLNLEFKACELP